MKKIIIKTLISFIFAVSILIGSSITANAVNTIFDVPTIDPNIQPDNMLYQSPNMNIIVCKWHYGLDANIINTSDLGTLISEVNANVSTAGYSRSILGIYPNGANLTDSDAQAIRNAGWTEVNLYYENFFVAGSAPSAGMTPSVKKVENADVLELLGTNYNGDDVAIVEVSGINMSWTNFMVYDEVFKYLNGKQTYAYKYILDVDKFIYLPESYCGSYSSGIIEVFDLQNAEDDVNGIYVVLGGELPADLVTTKENLPALREEIQDAVDDKVTDENIGENLDEVTEDGNFLADKECVTDDKGNVTWSFENANKPEHFTAETKIEIISKTEISVDFSYSGELPENTKVTIVIPKEGNNFKENDTLYLYYCNPDTGVREYVDESIYQNGQVTFDIYHCSEYVITAEYQTDVYMSGEYRTDTDILEKKGDTKLVWILVGAIVLTVCCVCGVLVIKRKKQVKKR